ncbi:SDR family NAD(P)-dependent oxidoreductase [Salinibacter altiplanensis]|uniref:SDR family NAD(P)-dependent oxidoreductase n=1 Tax=Salinibacter altiplanensis TaxID=1803181 RepID=UPI000C9F915D|nr:SDR family NAD(P)-dependent oxidoreductase [Salinibacter altiplanensis]
MPVSRSAPEHTTAEARLREWGPLFLALPDALLVYGSLLLGRMLHAGDESLSHGTEGATASLLVLGVYGAALGASGIYRLSPRRVHLSDLWRVGMWLVGAWGGMALTHVVAPATAPPPSVLAVPGLLAPVGILGLRVGCRGLLAMSCSTPTRSSPDPPPSGLDLSDLVPREPGAVDRTALEAVLSGRTVLVTGAGGSIGSELSRQLLALEPSRVVLVDVSERTLYRLERTLQANGDRNGLDLCMADVRDAPRMDALLAHHRPDVVIHAAAYKHVPLMERHPVEAFHNNTQASVQLLQLCEQHAVDRFIFVSTDKAVHPSSVLGTTKRLAEWYVRTGSGPMRCTTVRFGNVFGTEGGVVPRFEEKLAAGEPLPVTHPDMERYFMSRTEACGLILHTLLLDAAPTYSFRMGDPIRIEWLAKRFVRHWAPHVNPETMIEYVGRRPGEKLSERLVRDDETVHATEHPNILGLEGPVPYRRAVLNAHLQRLRSAAVTPHTPHAHLRHLLLEARPDDGRRRTNGARASLNP